MDAENGTYEASARGENSNNAAKVTNSNEEADVRQYAGFWGYAFQIIYQVNCQDLASEFRVFQIF